MLANLLWIALGGAVGSVVRYLVSTIIPSSAGVPWSTLAVNVGGSFLIGMALANVSRGDLGHYMGVVGFCGGFTTFSTFSVEVLGLIRNGAYPLALGYIAASVVICVVAVGLGLLVRFK